MNLTIEQKKIVDSNAQNILVLASAGSGKTTVIINRIKRLLSSGVDPENILALTFANKAAQNIRLKILNDSGISGENITVRTFHSFGLKLIRDYYFELGFDEDVKLASFSELRKLVDSKKYNVGAFFTDLDYYKSFDPDKQTQIKVLKSDIDNFMRQMKEKNLVDMPDMLFQPIKLLSENPLIRERICNQYRYIFVDEYQDTNDAQNKLLSLLKNKNTNICLVGDDDQAIYEWNGSKPRYSREKAASGEYTIYKLEKNFRSQSRIIEIADKLIHKNKNRTSKRILPDRGPGIKPIFHNLGDPVREAKYIARTIKKLIEGNKYFPSDIAILVRKNNQSEPICQALTKENIAFNYSNVKSDNSSYRSFVSVLRSIIYNEESSKFSKTLGDALNFPNNIMDSKDFAEAKSIYCANNKDFNESIGTLAWLKKFYDSSIRFPNDKEFRDRYELINLIKDAKDLKPTEVISMYVRYMENNSYNDSYPEKYRFVIQVFDIAKHYEDSYPRASLKDFIDHLCLTLEQDDSYRTNALDSVNVLTVHSAKGMEYKAVFIPGVRVGTFPVSLSSDDKIEEERRLFYVAITRAKDLLVITSDADPFGNDRSISPITHGFMAELPEVSYINAEEFEARLEQLSARPERPETKPISECVDENLNALIQEDRKATSRSEEEQDQKAQPEEKRPEAVQTQAHHPEKEAAQDVQRERRFDELSDYTDDELEQTLKAGDKQLLETLIAVSNKIEIPRQAFVIIIGDSSIDDMNIRKTLAKLRISNYERYDYDCSNLKGSGKFNPGKYFNNNKCIGIILGPNAHKQQGVETSSLKPKLMEPGYPFLLDLIDERITKTSLTNAIIKIKHNYAEEQKKLPPME